MNINTKEVTTLSGHTQDVLDVAFNSDGTKLASTAADGTFKVWDWASSSIDLDIQNGLQQYVFSVTWFGDKIATGDMDGDVRLWEATSGSPLRWRAWA